MKCWCGKKIMGGKMKRCETTFPEPHEKPKLKAPKYLSDYAPTFKR